MVEKDVEFVLEKELERGAFCVAYLGHVKSNHAPVVIKMLSQVSADECDADDLALSEQTFRQEIEFHATLSHPNIVQYIHGESKSPDPEACYLVVEWMQLGDLFNFINARQGDLLPMPMFAHFCKSITSAVNYLHQKNLIHRDIKIENVLIQETNGNFCLKLADFGFTTSCEKDNVVYEEHLLGTPRYLAPEIWKKGFHSQKSDVFALGTLFYILATYSFPFSDASTLEELGRAICTEQQMIPQYVSPDVSQLIETCWARKRFDRPWTTEILNHSLFKLSNNTPSKKQFGMANESTPLLAQNSLDLDNDYESDCCCVVS